MFSFYYFTGTGNCRALADELALLLPGSQVFSMTEDVLPLPAESRAAVLIFPVYSGGMPHAVFRFLLKAPFPPSLPLFAVAAYAYRPGAALSEARELILRRGWTFAGGFPIRTPQTFQPGKMTKDSDRSASFWQEIKERAVPELASSLTAVLSGEKAAPPLPEGTPEDRKKARAFRLLLPRFSQEFRSGDRCLSCGRCAIFCPTENIHMKDGRPSWGTECELCFGCLSACPVGAISWRGQAPEGHPYLNPDYRPPSKIARLRRKRKAKEQSNLPKMG